MSYQTIARREGTQVAPARPHGSWPVPDGDIVAAVRADLGRRRPPGSVPDTPQVDRFDLLVGTCHMQTAAVAVLWLNGERRQSRNTRISYADDLIYFGEWLRDQNRPRLDLTVLTRDDIALWLTHQRSLGRAPATIARRLASLSSLYRYAAGYGLPVVSPIHHDDHRPRIRAGRRATSARVLPAERIAGMFAACLDLRDAAVLGLLFTDGLRVSELCGTTSDDFDPDQRTLRVVRKGEEHDGGTRLQVAPLVADTLQRWLDTRLPWTGQAPTPLLYDRNGGRLTRDGVTRTLRRLARAAGIPHPQSVTPHAMRASAITDLILAGHTVTEVRGFSGHADVRTVMTYFENRDVDERNAAMATELSRLVDALPPWVADPDDALIPLRAAEWRP